MKRFRVSIEVEGESDVVGRLRHSLPEFIQGEGVTPTSGTLTVETWMLEARAEIGKERPLRGEWGPAISGEKSSRSLP